MPKKRSKSPSRRKPHLRIFRAVAENVSGLKGKALDRAIKKSLANQQATVTAILTGKIPRRRKSREAQTFDRALPAQFEQFDRLAKRHKKPKRK